MAITTDSASNNNTLINSVESICKEQNIDFTKKHNHIRCLAHIINLAAQDALSILKVGYIEFDNENEIYNQTDQVESVISKVYFIYFIYYIF